MVENCFLTCRLTWLRLKDKCILDFLQDVCLICHGYSSDSGLLDVCNLLGFLLRIVLKLLKLNLLYHGGNSCQQFFKYYFNEENLNVFLNTLNQFLSREYSKNYNVVPICIIICQLQVGSWLPFKTKLYNVWVIITMTVYAG